jgi:hypothetical protein
MQYRCKLCNTELIEGKNWPYWLSRASSYKCRTCAARIKKEWEHKNPDKVIAHRLKRHNLTPELYKRQLDAQGGGCAICGTPPQKKMLSCDHDHLTGKQRGLLCDKCNVMLGMSRDDVEILQRASQYLIQYKELT